MQNRYDDAEARAFVRRHQVHGEALALRVYTSRLIGADPGLVLHGGGNTSVKTVAVDAFGQSVEVLCVKGSGVDLAAVEPSGLPALELAPLRRLRALAGLDDAAMVAELRRRLLDPTAPDPSVETLLHAFLPHRFVDHVHADAIVALTDQPDGEQLVRAALGPDVAILPWIMPGFPLAQAVAAAFERQPGCVGIVLLHHGLFTFGDTAEQSYRRTIELVDRAERFVAARVGAVPAMLRGAPAPPPAAARRAQWRSLLPLLRGALADGAVLPVACLRDDEAMAAFAAHPAAPAACAQGPITADHVLRTKGRYLFLPAASHGDAAAIARAVADYAAWYRGYFEQHVQPRGGAALRTPLPVVVVAEGLGLAAFAAPRRAAAIAADLAEHTLRVYAQGHALGRFLPLPEADLAEFEYWPLELKKLGQKAPPPLHGRIALVTGAAGAIGCATAELLLERGACVCLVDRDPDRLQSVAARLARHGDAVTTAVADLTAPAAVAAAFDACVLAYGGVDLVVQSHGIAHVDRLEQLDVARFRTVVDVNATATMLVLQTAARVLRAQGKGGSIVLQVSKNAFAPGAGFGAYSASKAAALQLGRIAALEFAAFGVRVNMINADAVFGDDEVPSQLWLEVGPDRMQARGLDAAGLRAFYRERSLLKCAVTPRHVAEAVLFFALQATATTGAVLPVDGGLPEAFPR